MDGPHYFIEDTPHRNTILLAGRHINITLLSQDCKVDAGYISRILNGKRRASVDTLGSIASSLGMSLDDFRQAIAERQLDPAA